MHIHSRAKRLQTPINLALHAVLIAGTMLLVAACGGDDDGQTPTDSQTSQATNQTNGSTPATRTLTTGSQPTERSNQASTTVAPNRPASRDGTTATAPTSSDARPSTAVNAPTIPPATEEPETQPAHDPVALRLLDIAARYLLPELALASEEYAAIRHYAGKAIEADSTLAAAYILRAHAYNGFDQFDLALTDLDRAFQLHEHAGQLASTYDLYDKDTGVPTAPTLDFAHLIRAYALTRKGQHDAAQQSLDAQTHPNYETEIVQMLIDHNTENFLRAADVCCRDIRLYSIGTKIGAAWFDDYPQPELDIEIKLDPSNITALTERAGFNIWLGDYEAALADLDALETAGGPPSHIRSFRAALHLGSRNHEAVIRAQTEYLASQQVASLPYYRRWQYHAVRGQAHLATGRTDAAVADFEQSLAFRLNTPQEKQEQDRQFGRRISRSRYALGLAHIFNGDHQSGLAAYCGQAFIPACGHWPTGYLFGLTDLTQFYDSDDPWLHIYAGLANCAQRQDGDITCDTSLDTLHRFEHAIELDPSNTMARELRAIAHIAQHGVQDQRSDSYFTEALQTHPDPAALYRFRIPLLTKAELWDAVVADYDVLIAIATDNLAEHHFQRGEAHSKLENRDAAESDYLKALDLGYDQARVRGALTQLAR